MIPFPLSASLNPGCKQPQFPLPKLPQLPHVTTFILHFQCLIHLIPFSAVTIPGAFPWKISNCSDLFNILHLVLSTDPQEFHRGTCTLRTATSLSPSGVPVPLIYHPQGLGLSEVPFFLPLSYQHSLRLLIVLPQSPAARPSTLLRCLQSPERAPLKCRRTI